jgi:2-dehydro-3-deoxyphosphogluconate aldolase/(4S)-4-hydroxy-2-oxoglutarate aldolase
MDIDRFRRLPLLGILRGIAQENVTPLAETMIDAGLETVEITMNTPGATDLIRAMRQAAGGRLTVGAGTVLTMTDLDRAVDAGASFIVLPVLVREVVERCLDLGLPVFPGALTPQEIHDAWTAGATMVKVFPASFFGPAYFKEIRGPFMDVPLLACGGVKRDDLADYFASGASAVAFGASVFRADRLRAGEYNAMGAELRAWVDACRTIRVKQGGPAGAGT